MWTPASRHAQKCVWIKHLRRCSAPWIDFIGLQEKIGYGFNSELYATDFMIDHATAFKYTRIQLEVTAWWIICIIKSKK